MLITFLVFIYRQALNDVAEFVSEMNRRHKFTGPWITFGCSYGGSLAGWSRLKYPNLIHAAVSSSGPVLAEASEFLLYLQQSRYPILFGYIKNSVSTHRKLV